MCSLDTQAPTLDSDFWPLPACSGPESWSDSTNWPTVHSVAPPRPTGTGHTLLQARRAGLPAPNGMRCKATVIDQRCMCPTHRQPCLQPIPIRVPCHTRSYTTIARLLPRMQNKVMPVRRTLASHRQPHSVRHSSHRDSSLH